MRLWPYALLSLLSSAAFVACGSRTGLLVPEEGDGLGPSGSSGGDDNGGDDSGAADARSGDDRSTDRERDALPPLDVGVPQQTNTNCADAGTTFIYVVTEEFELLSFYPPTGVFTPIGTLSCPTRPPASGDSAPTPFSMAVDHTGIAYVLYSDGELFRVSTATASCQRTAFTTGQHGFTPTFGMGFSDNNGTGSTGETLFVASGGTTPEIATIDPTTFTLRVVASLEPPVDSAELTGTGAGDLFAFYSTQGAVPCDNFDPNVTCTDSAIGQIDKTTGQVTNQSVLFGNRQGTAWAFGFWGGDFYTFTAPTGDSGGTTVTRYRPTDGTSAVVARRTDLVVGAGVSTCAPAQ